MNDGVARVLAHQVCSAEVGRETSDFLADAHVDVGEVAAGVLRMAKFKFENYVTS